MYFSAKFQNFTVISGKWVTKTHFPGKSRNKDRTFVRSLKQMTQRISRLDKYLRTISATLKTMAWSNCRRSRPVSFLIFSRR